ncbi:MAG: PorV/PorQ family protein [Endomicrobia bacterium]|nr:PorV/PorQ family protein [Endomicrobiia bacterium]
MKSRIQITILIFFCIISTIYAGVKSGSGTSAFPFLKLCSGLRAQAMGENYVAVGENLATIYYNPTGIVEIKSVEVVGEYMVWSDILSKSNLSFVYPSVPFLGPIAFGFDYINIPFEKRETEDDENYESANVYICLAQISLAKRLKEKFSVGGSLKFIFQNLIVKDYTGIAVDFGIIYNLSEKINLGLSLQNLGKEFTENSDNLPMVLKVGQATKFFNNKLLIASDLNYGLVDETISIGVGSEYEVTKYFFPRIGYKYLLTNNGLDVVDGINIGFGVKYKQISFDYVFSTKSDLGRVHRVAFGYCF